MSRFLELVAAAALTLGAAGFALAQSNSSAPAGGGASTTTTPAKPAQDDLPPATGGIQGQNIFDVKPEVKRDASSMPGYMEQNNAQRNAVQPGNNSPMWRDVKSGVTGSTSLPYLEAGNLIQGQVQYPGSKFTSAGEAWRQVRNNWIIPYGGSLLLIVVLAMAIFYFTKGPLGHAPAVGTGGRRIERFTPFERAAHWSNAIAFVTLAVSGIIMAFGKFFLLPVIGQTLFGYLTYLLKNLHNFVGPLFVVSLVIIFLTFLRDNFPQRGDLRWLLRLGGMMGKGPEVPSHRFNTGEKGVFWGGVFLLGTIVIASGLVLDKLVPGLLYERATMQQAHMIHAVAAVLMMAVFLGHIYIGTIGMRGAYTAMRNGYVDEAWAQEHHAYWYEDVKAGKIPAQRSKPLAPIVDDTQAVRPV
jgi:formate dehydrogenase subunit gamma